MLPLFSAGLFCFWDPLQVIGLWEDWLVGLTYKPRFTLAWVGVWSEDKYTCHPFHSFACNNVLKLCIILLTNIHYFMLIFITESLQV